MRRAVGVAWIFCLLAGGLPAGAGEADEAAALLDKAVGALGGAGKLAPLAGCTCKTKGTVEAGGMKVELSGEWSALALDRYRWEVQIEADGRTETGKLVVNGDKVWAADNRGNASEFPKEIAAFLRAEFRVLRLAERLVPLRDKAYTLSPLGELKIEDRAAVGLKVAHKDQPDVDLFFDKETMLPVRAELRVKEPDGGEEVLHSYYFSDYKDAGGVKHFTKVRLRRDDKPLLEIALEDVKLHESLDDGLFAKP
jgi:hypothetical protein